MHTITYYDDITHPHIPTIWVDWRPRNGWSMPRIMLLCPKRKLRVYDLDYVINANGEVGLAVHGVYPQHKRH
jgi:hypothetical protein